MNWDQIEGSWKQVKGKVKENWGDLTDDEIDKVKGQRDQFVGLIQTKYGILRERAEKEVDSFIKNCSC
jgi:uncharacterized protein YjbJ (UPF0337 family)